MGKRVVLIGNGGREHALANALKRSSVVGELFNIASFVNPGIKRKTEDILLSPSLTDIKAVVDQVKRLKPDFAVIGPDDPIGMGLADALEEINVPTFAPKKTCARVESSKAFTRELLKKYNIGGYPAFLVIEKEEDLESQLKDFYHRFEGNIVVKADGLLGGKGVIVAGEHFTTFPEALDFAAASVERFGRVVLEERLEGEEFSFIFLTDGKVLLETPIIQDHKRAFEGDTGPNTGGMGCISDANHSLPFLTQEDKAQARALSEALLKAVYEETGVYYKGVLYGGFMATKDGVKIIEYNARFGDPEALNILPILEDDFGALCLEALEGGFTTSDLSFRPVATVVTYLCPEGYPQHPVKEVPIEVDPRALEDDHIFFASVEERDGGFFLKGSRAVGVLGTGSTIAEAKANCESRLQYISGPLFYRKDIGSPALLEKRIKHMQRLRGTS